MGRGMDSTWLNTEVALQHQSSGREGSGIRAGKEGGSIRAGSSPMSAPEERFPGVAQVNMLLPQVGVVHLQGRSGGVS